jgi:hypothetical protein
VSGIVDVVTQIGIGTVSLTTTRLSISPRWQKYAFIPGIAAQPFWMVDAIRHHQWVTVGLSIIYGYIWIRKGLRDWGHLLRSSKDDQE